MGGLDSGGGRESIAKLKKAAKSRRKKRKRVGVRIDMTPMVDIAFLLLTFFMLTTTMQKPVTMEINLPPGESKVEVAESNLLTLRVNDKFELFWNMGVDPPQKLELPTKVEKNSKNIEDTNITDFTNLHKLLTEKAQANPKLITLLKVDNAAKYRTMVDIMDEFNLASIVKFSIAPMGEEDKLILTKITGGIASNAKN